jgi:hypothetical protein
MQYQIKTTAELHGSFGTCGLGRWFKLEQSNYRIAAAGFQGRRGATAVDVPE